MPTEVFSRKETLSTLSIYIDKEWRAKDFSVLFDSVNRLYNFLIVLDNSLTAYRTHGDELQWHPRLKNLPAVEQIRVYFLSASLRIFSNDVDYNNLIAFQPLTGDYRTPETLIVKKINYSSPGCSDLGGMGKIFESLKDLLIEYLPSKSKKIDIEIKKKEIEEKEQRILQMKIQNLKDLGLSSQEIMMILGYESHHINVLSKLASDGKIVDLKIDNNPTLK